MTFASDSQRRAVMAKMAALRIQHPEYHISHRPFTPEQKKQLTRRFTRAGAIRGGLLGAVGGSMIQSAAQIPGKAGFAPIAGGVALGAALGGTVLHYRAKSALKQSPGYIHIALKKGRR